MDSLASILHKWWQHFITILTYPSLLPYIFLFLSVLYLLCYRNSRPTIRLPPSPPKLPIIGNLHQIGKLPHRSFNSLSQKYGPLMLLHIAATPNVVVSSVELVQEITNPQDVIFVDRPHPSAGDIFFYGCSDMVFSPYGEYWKQVRKVCVQELLSQKRVTQFCYIRQEETSKLVNILKEAALKGEVVNLSNLLATTSNNIVSKSALGRIYDSEEADTIGILVKEVSALVLAFSFKDEFPFLAWIDSLRGFNYKVKKASKALHDFLDEIIDAHEKSFDHTDDKKRGFVDILLQLQKDWKIDNIKFTRENLKAILLDMFVFGTDTTSTAMDWGMAEIIKNPRVMKKAQDEITQVVVGNKGAIQESDVDQMNYLKCIIKETLRLHSTAVIAKKTTANTKSGGYDIPAKTRVIVNAWAIARDPLLWDNAEEFIPERFLNGRSIDYRGHNEYLPFGGGKRICPGILFANREMEVVLANLLFLFDWKLPLELPVEDLDMTEYFSLIIRKKQPLLVIPILRSV